MMDMRLPAMIGNRARLRGPIAATDRLDHRMRHHLIGVARAAGILAVALAAWLAFLQVTGNFHAVIPGEYYRSAQVDRASLSEWTREHRIRSVVNLRGANPGDAWYDEEVAASAELGLVHYDFRMSAADHIPPAEAKALLDLLRAAPKPVLVHCRRAAGRCRSRRSADRRQRGGDQHRRVGHAGAVHARTGW